MPGKAKNTSSDEDGTEPRPKTLSAPRTTSEAWERIAQPHIDSFDFMLDAGLDMAIANLAPVEIPLYDPQDPEQVRNPHKDTLTVWIDSATVGFPTKSDDSADQRIFPAECRERHISYNGALNIAVKYSLNGDAPKTIKRKVGQIPIMVGSKRCHTAGLTAPEKVAHHEDSNSFGGYFITNGIERCIRMLQIPKRNFVHVLSRNAYLKRGTEYSDKACFIRSTRQDESGVTLTLHYLKKGDAMVSFVINKQQFFISIYLLLRCLRETTDKQIFNEIIRGDFDNSFIRDRIEFILHEGKRHGVFKRRDALSLVGSRFRVALEAAPSLSDEEVGEHLLENYILVHLDDCDDKFCLLIFMLQKLLRYVNGSCVEDNSDALANQEILTAGHLYLRILKEKLYDYVVGVKRAIATDVARVQRRGASATAIDFASDTYFKKKLEQQADIGRKLDYFMATGNLVSNSGLDLLQISGYTIVAEKLNVMRYLSHFRSVHRGAFFSEMKTTAVRKLLPESWGFLCCVHTPDGAPCGLLGHLTSGCVVQCTPERTKAVVPTLVELGMMPSSGGGQVVHYTLLQVLLDGRVVGGIGGGPDAIAAFVARLRMIKSDPADKRIPATTEIVYVAETAGPYPGIFLHTCSARMMRQCLLRYNNQLEWIGPMEQSFLDIACEEAQPAGATHVDTSPMNILSWVASFTPFSDMNQSPRNMYQCQMAKQTMGSPCHNYAHRTDNKMYRLQTPQAPMVYNENHELLHIDDFSNGTNAVVAVISYTGYDMEDAVIINKSSYERGFGHGTMYKTQVFDVSGRQQRMRKSHEFIRLPPIAAKINVATAQGRSLSDAQKFAQLGPDGVIAVGTQVTKGTPLVCIYNEASGSHRFESHKSTEPAVVDEVRFIGNDSGAGDGVRTVSVKLRYDRNPVVGDKFASRHGQKGVLSWLWPQADMPFSGSGINPDIIINPHAFPSRMTIGMLLESMAGKTCALAGKTQDSTPFKFDEKQRAVDYVGSQLRAAGYNYYGTEELYSGVAGCKMQADVFIGVVYYQRLRHMVKDKSQVRASGPINPLTRQPVKGRKKHGGIRFGEMERDALIGHGAAFLMHDRLMNCSDRHVADICTRCHSILSPCNRAQTSATAATVYCRSCDGDVLQPDGEDLDADSDVDDDSSQQKRGKRQKQKRNGHRDEASGKKPSQKVARIVIPYVVRYLVNQLAAMNVKVAIDTSKYTELRTTN